MNFPKRKINRLFKYDYSQNGSYFITICAYEKTHIFGEIVMANHSAYPTVGAGTDRPQIILSEIGKIVDNTINDISKIYPSTSVDIYTVMPNHVHMILTIDNPNSGRQVAAPTIIKIIGHLKRFVSMTAKKLPCCPNHIWQKGFYDHIIRDDKSYKTKWNYIDTNTDFWHEDEYH